MDRLSRWRQECAWPRLAQIQAVLFVSLPLSAALPDTNQLTVESRRMASRRSLGLWITLDR